MWGKMVMDESLSMTSLSLAFFPSIIIPKYFPSKFSSLSKSLTSILRSGVMVSIKPVSKRSATCRIITTFMMIFMMIILLV